MIYIGQLGTYVPVFATYPGYYLVTRGAQRRFHDDQAVNRLIWQQKTSITSHVIIVSIKNVLLIIMWHIMGGLPYRFVKRVMHRGYVYVTIL